MPLAEGSTENDAKLNFLRNIYCEWVLTPYPQGAQEISFKLHLFEMPWKFMGKWTNSTNLCAVTDGPLSIKIRQGCTFHPKKKIPYWSVS